MKPSSRSRRLLIRSLALCLAASLALAPVPAKASFTVGDEKKVGEKLLNMVRQNFEVIDDPDISSYVNALGRRILEVAGPQFFDYHFFIIKNKEFNAFAAPSGLIFIHTGLIEAMDNEGELISVMAHEIAHVTSRHISDRIRKQKKATIGTAAMMIAGLIVGGGALSQALVTGSMAAGASMSLKFSRQDEEEADRLAYKWMRAMGLDPHPQATMLAKMHKISIYSSAKIPPYLLTHPEPKRRQGYVEDLIESDGSRRYVPRDDFDFWRIQQRVRTKTKTPQELKAMCARKLRRKNLGVKEAAMARYGLAMAYAEDADYDRAEAELRKVMDVYADKNILRADLAVILRQGGDKRQALDILKEVHDKMPDSAYVAFHLATCYQELGYNGKALELYNRLLAVLPDYAQLHYNLGGILMASPGGSGRGHYHMGRYFWLTGNRKSAEYHFRQALTDPATDQETRRKIKAFRDKQRNLGADS